ncbi:hypothetical protein [Cupriavidus basilensis]|uniref:hypothetical protein n=1 Tax=Cupriavidus basilensis TaxID=68895 RepID=UPI0020A62CD9|nr:hypothetical protein [Cupriavidus basilensis]MCP3017435.1 hypothetical protein [Cupriavidus basilensis]
MAREISNCDDVIDSRDVIARIEELEEYEEAVSDTESDFDDAVNERNDARKAVEELTAELEGAIESHGYGSKEADAVEEQLTRAKEKFAESEDALVDAESARASAREDFDQDMQDELKVLRELAEQGEGYGDWAGGETLIRREYFPEYARQFAEDIGAINRDARWPLQHIDWEAAADELEDGYTVIDFDGTDFLMRA